MPIKNTPKSATANGQSRAAPNPDLVDCRTCGRHFAPDRVAKHESICQKSANSKRKVFNILEQRVKGTEAEKYVKKGAKQSSSLPGVNNHK